MEALMEIAKTECRNAVKDFQVLRQTKVCVPFFVSPFSLLSLSSPRTPRQGWRWRQCKKGVCFFDVLLHLDCVSCSWFTPRWEAVAALRYHLKLPKFHQPTAESRHAYYKCHDECVCFRWANVLLKKQISNYVPFTFPDTDWKVLNSARGLIVGTNARSIIWKRFAKLLKSLQ